MRRNEDIYKIALSFLKGINAQTVRLISEKGLSPEDFFKLTKKELINYFGEGIGNTFDNVYREEAELLARQEIEKIQHHHIKPLFLLDDDYPVRLKEIEDAPVILYKLGEADLDADKLVSVVGTRRPTPYGVDFCGKLLEELSLYFNDLCVVSGLAYGIDAVSHRKALERGLPTVAVVAHGLDMIYPANHRNLGRELIRKGGAIVSEYPFGTKPFRGNFLARNRIIAGLSDVSVIIESALRGGAMSTANFAFLYSREVMALPGRINDELSQGCNLLIRKQKASLIGSAADMIEVTGWRPLNIKVTPKQRNLFPELSGESQQIYEILKLNSDPVQIDRICHLTGLGAAKVLALMGEMEFEGIIIRHPGNRFSIA